jgi:hypothetical protein
MIGTPARQLPGGDLVPFGASSTQRGEVVPVLEAQATFRTDQDFRLHRPPTPCAWAMAIRAIKP